jgi:hypothetical protein
VRTGEGRAVREGRRRTEKDGECGKGVEYVYHVSPKGREILTAVLAAHQASLRKLTQLAA